MMKPPLAQILKAVGLGPLAVTYHKSRLTRVLQDMKRLGTETHMPSWCGKRFQHHQQALMRLGFVLEREFGLQRRQISGSGVYRAFCQLMRARFPDGYWSCKINWTRVIVIAPPAQMIEWEQFLSEYDRAETANSEGSPADGCK